MRNDERERGSPAPETHDSARPVTPGNESEAGRFRALFEQHYGDVMRYARRRTDGDTANEIVADTFMVTWQRLDDVPEHPLPWLYAVARNRLLYHHRREGRLRRAHERGCGALEWLTPRVVDDHADAVADGDRARRLLNAFSAADREALLLIAWGPLDRRGRRRPRVLGGSAAGAPVSRPPEAAQVGGGRPRPGGSCRSGSAAGVAPMSRTRTEQAVRDALASSNPLPPERPLDTEDARPAAGLVHAILMTPTEALHSPADASLGRLVPTRRLLFAGAAGFVVLALLALLAVVLPGATRDATAATPPLVMPMNTTEVPAGPLLEQAAAAADTQSPLPLAGDGAVRHLKTAGWYLHSTIDGGSTFSEIVPSVTETWIRPDGSVVQAISRGRPYPADAPGGVADERARDALPDPDADVTLQQSPAGMFDGAALESLPTDPSALRDELINRPDLPDVVELYTAVRDRALFQPLPPQLRAAFWRALAQEPDIVGYGPVTDRAGRDALAVGFTSSYSGLPSRYLLLLDPRTGALLGTEELLTTDPGALDVEVPAVISYTVWLEADTVPAGDVPTVEE